MTSHDHLGIMIDWLDAYRDRDLGLIVDLYVDEAEIRCRCTGETLRGKLAVEKYWRGRLQELPAGELIDLRTSGDNVVVTYCAGDGVVEASFSFAPDGRVSTSICGPLRRA